MVTRGKGQSVIARAAYIAREKLTDERTNETKNYRYLGEPEWNGIFAPDHAPEWALDRQQLWNAVERREDESTRPDQAQLARDLKIALPHELDIEQRRALVEDFAREMAQKGMVVDVAIHAPDADNDERNVHVHVLLTMREITPDGFGKKVREWNRDTELEQWRERWSELGSHHLERAGFELEAERFRVGHMTLQRQREAALQRGDYAWAESLDRAPTKHMGPHTTAMENRGIATTKGDQNREIEGRNEQRAARRHLSRTEGEIRLAYQLTDRAQGFADALEDRGLILARVAVGDLEKLAALERRRFEEKETEHLRKRSYLDGRIGQEEQGGDAEKAAELRQRREELEGRYQDSLPWMAREGGAKRLSPDQRATAERSYDQWRHKNRHDFEDYVSYVQQKWKERPLDRSRFRPEDLVVVNQDGHVYALTQRNTGDDPKLLRRYLREIETAPLFSVIGAWEVLRTLKVHQREGALWPERERVWPTTPKTLPGLRPSSSPVLNSAAPWWDFAGSYVTRDRRPLDAPDEINKPGSTRFPEQPDTARIWEAYNRNKHDAKAFAGALEENGILLCAATKMEADQSYRRAAFARELNRYSPGYQEAEILAMGSDARIYKLNQRTTGAEPADVDRFLRKVDTTELPTIDRATQTMQQRAEGREACAQLMSALNPVKPREFDRSAAIELRRLTRYIRDVVSDGIDVVARPIQMVGRFFEFSAKTFESLFAPILSPVQKRHGELADRERQIDAAEAERQRRHPERDR